MDVQDEAALLEVRAKNAAANFLRKRSYEIVERDWRCSEGGADIVARREGAFVFAEVVSQNGNEPFEEESVASTEKGERIKAACTFMRERGEGGGEMRFETVLVTFFDKDRAILAHWTDGCIKDCGGREGRTFHPVRSEGRDAR